MSIIGPNEARLRSEEVRKTQAHRRREQVVALHAAGLSVDEIASKLGVVRRTVFRDLRESGDSIRNVDKILHDDPIDAEDLHLRLSQMFDADLADLYDEKGELKPVKQWPRVWRNMAKLTGRGGIETLDPARVLEIAMKHRAIAASEAQEHDVTFRWADEE